MTLISSEVLNLVHVHSSQMNLALVDILNIDLIEKPCFVEL